MFIEYSYMFLLRVRYEDVTNTRKNSFMEVVSINLKTIEWKKQQTAFGSTAAG